MAPIDPKEILKAFGPVCSDTGGITSTKDVPRLADLIKKYSKKMVSKCTYINILLATDEVVLEEFLECEGWQTIFIWLQDAVEKRNVPLLFELVKILNKCPITLNRIKENDMPKLLKTVTELENAELTKSAKQLRSKWRAIVNKEQNAEIDREKLAAKEKRKLQKEATDKENGQLLNSGIKKLKKNENANPSPIERPNTNSSVSKKVIDSVSSRNLDTQSESQQAQQNGAHRNIKTALCKQGKSRSIGVLEKDSHAKSLITSVNDPKSVTNSFMTKSSMLLNPTASTPSKPLNKLTKLIDKGIQLIDAQPLPPSELIDPKASHTTKHVIKESAGFADALSLIPSSISKLKKKKKNLSTSADKQQSTSTIKEKTNDIERDSSMDCDSSFGDANTSNRILSDNNSMECTENANVTDEHEFLTFATKTPYDPSREPTKGIMLFIPRGNKRKITWPDDDQLEKVKYFELDENERTRVREFNESRKQDAEKERKELNNIRTLKYLTNNPGQQFGPWHLIPIELPDEQLTINEKIASLSEEKIIQHERLGDVLPHIDLAGRPEWPSEPETEIIKLQIEPKLIPLQDEDGVSNLITDHSDKLYMIEGVPQSNTFATSQQLDGQFYGNNSIAQQSINTQFVNNVNHLFNDPNLYTDSQQQQQQQPHHQQHHPQQQQYQHQQQQQQQYYYMYSNGNQSQQHQMFSSDQHQHLPPQQPMSNRWDSTNNSWDNSTINSNNQQQRSNSKHPQSNFYGKNKNGRGRDDGKKTKQLVCKFYAKDGNCRFNNNCKYLHPAK